MNAPLDRHLLDLASLAAEDQARHPWRFFSAGGFTQVRLDTGADFVNLKQLDQKLWVALSCPVQGLEFDRRTLALMDTDNDGHIRAPELIAAIDWAAARLASPDVLARGGPLPLAALDIDSEAGARLLTSARHVLDSLGKGGSDSISVEDVSDSDRIFSGMAFNGDGVITAAACDEALEPVFAAIVDTLGSVPDRSGAPGIDGARADRFFTEAEAWLAWQSRPHEDATLLPLGADTESAFAALAAIRVKADDYFTRCRLAEFDPRAAELMNGAPEEIRAVGARSLTADDAVLAALPIAYVQPGGALPLESGINPAWTAAVAALRDQVVQPLLGDRESLGAGEWENLKDRFAAYQAWQAARPETPLAKLETSRLQAFLAPGIRAAIDGLLSRDLALAPEADAIAEVERLVRYVRDLEQLANNFVSFRNFYSSEDKAVFQAGTLFLDGRSCELCIKVLDPARHGVLASLSGVYLAYCDCVRAGQKMTIAAAFTAGDSDQLMVGRNGIFYDREGKDWDATITKIVDHPISIRQAFWAPYRKATRLISEQMEKFAATRAKGVDDMTSRLVTEAGSKVESGARPGPAPTPFDAARFAGIFAALGLAIGAIGTALASVVTGFLGLKGWQMPLAMVGLFLAISGPSVAMAFFKLRNRNLGPILDANGWAVNARARINIPFGTALTRMARLPEGAERSLRDPYVAQGTSWKLYLVLGMLAAAALTWLGFNTGVGGFKLF
ncbi:hypothetical protein [Massilia sp. UBA6681]|uniref:hypothetical protein n=1 Tax=Massilia sp. UBA6681 TaxID=1946839 RepID=UPI0025BC4ED4|nr:hypothetical protein [Massilia sp. UBA6681]